MSESTGRRRDAGARRGLPPWAVLLCGALATGICLLLLFGPFYPYTGTPGEAIRHRLLMLLDGRGPRILSDLLWNWFFLSTTVVLGMILMLLPWGAARERRRGGTAGASGEHHRDAGPRSDAGAARVSITERSTSLTFSDDGSIQDPEDPDAVMIERSVSDLRAMARAARIPWRTDYETSGGARAFLEVLRALGTGPVGVHRAEDARVGASSPDTAVEPADTTVAAFVAADTSDTAVASAAGTAERPSAEESSSSPGSVYTPTTLYRSSTWDGDAEEDLDEEGQG
ncbi:hypothetical protein ACT3SQ_01965 [Brachybacterium sp. AOP42-C2-15]|uniref:hypothetical protein n=1 Tax=unclassified Brachybacterium TaxID=2623841 RepID=UPI003F912E4B